MGLFGKLIGNLPSTSPPAGSVTLGDLAPLASFSVIGNETASSATPTAVNLMGIPGQTSTATAAGTTTLTNVSKGQQIFTGVTTQTITLPVVTTLPILGFGYWIINNSTGALTVNSSGGNLVLTIAANGRALIFCKLLTGTTAASWDSVHSPALGTMATQNANAVAITGGSITGITDLAIADGGTGASTAADALTNLGAGTRGGAPIPVADQTARLALTGLSKGARVEQADALGRIYEYLGGGESTATNWSIPFQSAVLEADFPKTNDTLTNVPFDKDITLLAGRWYRVTGRIQSLNANVAGVFNLNGGSATVTGMSGLSFTAASGFFGAPVIDLTTDMLAGAADNADCYFDVTIQVNAGGTLIPQYAQASTDAAASTLTKYATITATDITPT